MKKIKYIIYTFLLSIIPVINILADDNSYRGKEQNVLYIAGIVLLIIRIIVPILLIVMSSIDLVRAMTQSDDREIRKVISGILPKVIAAIIIFILPSIVSLLMTITNQNDLSINCLLSPFSCRITWEGPTDIPNNYYNDSNAQLTCSGKYENGYGIASLEANVISGDIKSYNFLINDKTVQDSDSSSWKANSNNILLFSPKLIITDSEDKKKTVDCVVAHSPHMAYFEHGYYYSKGASQSPYPSNQLQYWVYISKDLSSNDKAALIVALHHDCEGANHFFKRELYEKSNSTVKNAIDSNKAIIIAPTNIGCQWGDSSINNVLDIVYAFVKLYNIDLDRIVVTGASQGGYGTLNMAYKDELRGNSRSLFSLLVPMEPAKNGDSSKFTLEYDSKKIPITTPIWLVTYKDTYTPIKEFSEKLREYYNNRGDIRHTILAGSGHTEAQGVLFNVSETISYITNVRYGQFNVKCSKTISNIENKIGSKFSETWPSQKNCSSSTNEAPRILSVTNVGAYVTVKAAKGESGKEIAGYYFSTSSSKPTGSEKNWVPKSSDTLVVAKLPGTYYVYVKDANNKISDSKQINITLEDVYNRTMKSSAVGNAKREGDQLSSRLGNNDTYNNFIAESVRSAGLFTKEGVLTAGLAGIVWLQENKGKGIPYSQCSQRYNVYFGANPEWGSPSGGGNCLGKYRGLDCQSFVGWSVHNGGFKARNTYGSYGRANVITNCNKYKVGSNGNINYGLCDEAKSKSEIFDMYRKAQMGDIIANNSHVRLVLYNDTSKQVMYTLEGTTPAGISKFSYDDLYGSATMRYWAMTKMTNYYSNSNNHACLNNGRVTLPSSWKDLEKEFNYGCTANNDSDSY